MKKALVILLAIIMVMATTPIAFAEADVIKGEGKLMARGSGRAIIEATGTVELFGSGYLEITDPNGTADIKFNGKAKRIWKDGNTTYYQRFKGRVYVKGDGIKVHLVGRANPLIAKGEGKAVFFGKWKIHKKGKRVPAPNGREIPINQ